MTATSPWRSPHRRRSASGFTLIEALVAMGIIAILAAFGIPALQLMFARSKLQGSAREIAVQLGSSRVASMRLGRNVVVLVKFDEGALQSFVDDNDNLIWDEALDEDELSKLPLPGSGGNRGVYLMGPDRIVGTQAEPAQSIDGLTATPNGPAAVFQPDGSVEASGGIRIADGKDPANVFEVRVDPTATARVELLKYVLGDTRGLNPDAEGSWFSQGGNMWEWY